MKKMAYLLLAVYLPCQLIAQDSTQLDLGRLQLKKDFTQSVTIKGAELEKMPFANLKDALQVWFNGAYTEAGNLLVVIDGNLVNDVNAWSIYDIEEVTLIQNAAAVLNGAVGQRQLVIIKTKTSQPGKMGLTAAGQTFLVTGNFQTLNGKKLESTGNLFHQYYLSGYRNFKNVQVGISAGYLRDVMPSVKADTVASGTPFQFNSVRLNGWMNAQLGKKHSLTVRIGYAPQRSKAEDSYRMPGLFSSAIAYEGKASGIYPSLRLYSALSSHFTNELNGAYLSGSDVSDSARVSIAELSGLQSASAVHQDHDIRVLLIRDQLTYHAKWGKWNIDPSINIQYRHFNDISQYGYVSFINGSTSSIVAARSQRKGNLLLLTPGVQLNYGNVFSIQGGTLLNLSSGKSNNSKDVLPYVTTTLDLLKLSRPGSAKSLKVFGSYAEGEDLFEQVTYIRDVAVATQVFPAPFYMVSTGVFPGNSSYSPISKVTGAGLSLGLPADKVELSYQFTHRSFYGVYLEAVFTGTGYLYVPAVAKFKTASHRVGIQSKLIAQKDFNWYSGINMTVSSLSSDVIVSGTDIFKRSGRYSGGWVNRFAYKQLSLGANLLYLINEHHTGGPLFPAQQESDILLQNLYIAYQVNLPKLNKLEVYADVRNLAQDNMTTLTDRRKYYGIGFKAQL